MNRFTHLAHLVAPLRRLGWLTLIAFTVKGVVTTALIVWALLQAST